MLRNDRIVAELKAGNISEQDWDEVETGIARSIGTTRSPRRPWAAE